MMAKQLHLDSNRIAQDYIKAVSRCCDELLEEYFQEIRFQMRSPSGKDDLDAKSMDDLQAGMLRRQVIGGAWAIIDSWGMGSKMDKSNPFLAEYMDSSLFNPLRSGYEIVGRPPGSYVNIFGETTESSGSMAGSSVESFIQPREPSKAFQQAWQWFKKGERIDKKLAASTSAFFANVRANPGKYFRYY
jgi:hypothetical protein